MTSSSCRLPNARFLGVTIAPPDPIPNASFWWGLKDLIRRAPLIELAEERKVCFGPCRGGRFLGRPIFGRPAEQLTLEGAPLELCEVGGEAALYWGPRPVGAQELLFQRPPRFADSDRGGNQWLESLRPRWEGDELSFIYELWSWHG